MAKQASVPFKYSGPLSKEFWRRVNALSGSSWDALYSAGVELQNLEHKVLKQLEVAENNGPV